MKRLSTLTFVFLSIMMLVLSSCVKTDEVDTAEPKIPNEDLELIKLLGYNLTDIQEDEGSYLVEGDIRLTDEYLQEIRELMDADTVKTRQTFAGLDRRISPANQGNISVDISGISEDNDWQTAFFHVASAWSVPGSNIWINNGSGTNSIKVTKLTGKPNVFMECTPPSEGKPGTVKINLSYTGASSLDLWQKQMHAVHALGHALGLGHTGTLTAPDFNAPGILIPGTPVTDYSSVMRIHSLSCDDYMRLSYEDEEAMRTLYPLLWNMTITGPSSVTVNAAQPAEFWVDAPADYIKVVWSAPGMTITSTPADSHLINARFSQTGNITLKATVHHNGAIATSEVTRTINVNHGIVISGPTSVKQYLPAEFTVNVPSGTAVTWTIPDFVVTSGSGTNNIKGMFTSTGAKRISATTRYSGTQINMTHDVTVATAPNLSAPTSGYVNSTLTYSVIDRPASMTNITWEFRLNNTVINHAVDSQLRASVIPTTAGTLTVKATVRDPNGIIPEVVLQKTTAISVQTIDFEIVGAPSSSAGRELRYYVNLYNPSAIITWSFKLNGQTMVHNITSQRSASVTPDQTGTLTVAVTVSDPTTGIPPATKEMNVEIRPRNNIPLNIFDQPYCRWGEEYSVKAFPSKWDIESVTNMSDYGVNFEGNGKNLKFRVDWPTRTTPPSYGFVTVNITVKLKRGLFGLTKRIEHYSETVLVLL